MVFFPIGKICKYEIYVCLQNGFIKHIVLLNNIIKYLKNCFASEKIQ